MSEGKTRDLVLPPGTYAYMQDTSKGVIKTYSGACAATLAAQDRPITYDGKTGRFEEAVSLEHAICKSPVAVEGYYIELLNRLNTWEARSDWFLRIWSKTSAAWMRSTKTSWTTGTKAR